MNKILLSGAFSIMSITLNASEIKQYPVDENVFLKKIVDVSSTEEKRLNEELLKAPSRQYSFPIAKVENINGSLKITNNSKPIQMLFRSCGATTLPGAPVERMMRESGIDTFIIDIDFSSKLTEVESHAFKMFKSRANNVLEAAPDAKLIIRIWMTRIGDDFIEQHPDSLLTGPNGETKCDDGLFKRYGKYYYPNMLGKWKRWYGQYLRSFLELVGNSEYASKIIGCYIGAMNTGEWWYYKPTPFVWDYSETRKEAFVNFLQIKYGDDVKRLSESGINGYEGKNITQLPSPDERSKLSITPCSKVSDYNQVLNLPVTESIIFFAKIIKAVSGNRMLAGFELHPGMDSLKVNGTLLLSQVIESEYVDFLGGPAEYEREPGSSPWFRLIDGSLKQHGKIWLNEGDYRTHNAYGTLSGIEGESTLSPEETKNVMRREFSRMIIKDYYTYLMDFQWHWFFDKKLSYELEKLNAIQKFIEKSGILRHPQIALVSDQESQFYSNYFANPTRTVKIFNEKLGCDSEFFELKDFLESKNIDNFKIIIFLNIRALSDQERAEIEKLKTKNRILVWMHDPGMINLTRINPDMQEDLKSLINMDLNASDRDIAGKIFIDPNKYSQTVKNIPAKSLVYDGSENNVIQAQMSTDVCICDCAEGSYVGNVLKDVECIDPDAIKLGHDATGKCRFAIKKFPSWTSVYTASCLIDPLIIKDLAKLAGCKIYDINTNDILFVSENLLAVHSATSGKKNISLPVKSGVYEIFSKQIISENTDHIELDMKFGETKLFFLGNPAMVEKGINESYENLHIENQEFIKKYPAPEVTQGSTEFCRTFPPEKFFSLGSRRKRNVDTGNGVFPIIDLCPSAFLFAGPFRNNPECIDKVKMLMKGLSERPELIKMPLSSTNETFKISRKANSFLEPLDRIQLEVPSIDNIHWNSISSPLPWIYDYALGMKEKQLVLIAFFLKGKPGDKSEILFISDGHAELLFNGKALHLSGTKGNRGIIIEHSEKNDIVTIMFSNKNNPLGESGFSFKVFKPDPQLKPGQQVRKHTENVFIKLSYE